MALNTFDAAAEEGTGAVQGTVAAQVASGEGEGGAQESAAQLILSEALPVVPARLVKKILKGDYVDMAELLKDNMEVERRRAGAGGEAPIAASRREVPDILSWLHCFSLYAAVITSKYPEKAKDLLAYQALMIGEHRRCGGRGWLLYDAAFRQQITSLEGADFARLNQSLYLTTFVAYGGKGRSCSKCLLSDHSQEECALRPREARDRREAGQGREERERKKRNSHGTTAGARSHTGLSTFACDAMGVTMGEWRARRREARGGP